MGISSGYNIWFKSRFKWEWYGNVLTDRFTDTGGYIKLNPWKLFKMLNNIFFLSNESQTPVTIVFLFVTCAFHCNWVLKKKKYFEQYQDELCLTWF